MRATCLLLAALAAGFSPLAQAHCGPAILSEHYEPELQALIRRARNRPARVRDAWTLLVYAFLQNERQIRSQFVRHDFLRASLIHADSAHHLDFGRRVLNGQTGNLQYYAARVVMFARQFDRRREQADARESAASKVGRFDSALQRERGLFYDPKTAEVIRVAASSIVDLGTTGRKGWIPQVAELLMALEELAGEELVGLGDVDVRQFFPPFLFVGGNTVFAPEAVHLVFHRFKRPGAAPTFALRVLAPPIAMEQKINVGEALKRIRNTVAALEETNPYTGISRIELVIPEDYFLMADGYEISTRVAIPGTNLGHLIRPDGRDQTVSVFGEPLPVLVRVLERYHHAATMKE